MTPSRPPSLLTFDRGNTHLSCTAWTVVDGLPEELSKLRLDAASLTASEPALNAWLGEWLGEPDSGMPQECAAMGSTVVPQGLQAIRGALKLHGVRLLSVPQDVGPSMAMDYDTVETLGADRWLAALAAHRVVGGAAVVVDAGSCVTVDGVSAVGCYIGGAIAPGFSAVRNSLVSAAPALPHVEFPVLGQRFPASPARGSVDAVTVGVCVGFLGTVEKLMDELLTDPRMQGACLVLTGGDADWLSGALRWPPQTQVRLDAQVDAKEPAADAALRFGPLKCVKHLVHYGLFWLWFDDASNVSTDPSDEGTT